jgi:hypothetical protein
MIRNNSYRNTARVHRLNVWCTPVKTRTDTGKDIHPKTGHEDPEGEYRYSTSLSLTSALDGVGGQRHAPAALPTGKRPGTHCTEDWVGPRAGQDKCGKSRLHRDSIPVPSSP